MRKTFLLFLAFFYITSFAQDSINVKLYRENIGKTYYLYADNEEFAPVSLEYNFTSQNMSSSLANKSLLIIPAGKKKHPITELKAVDSNVGTKFNYDVYFVLGDVNTNVSTHDFVYSLPFEKNKKHKIYQGYNGVFSHHKAFSLDFSLKDGEKVNAARGGKVVSVITGNSKNCLTKECAKYNNRIVILHNDGTLAEYVHLKYGGSVVKPGEDVATGQLIGYSGNTGWSKGPHLHFSVYINNIDGTRTYLKTKFKVAESKTPVYLSEKHIYTNL